MNFNDILKTKVVSVAPPPLLPFGSYLCRVGSFRTVTKQIDGAEKGLISFGLTVIDPQADVDEEAIESFGGRDKLRGHKMKHDIFIGDDGNLFNVVQFAREVCKVDKEDENLNINELLAETNGVMVLVVIQHKPRKKGDGFISVIDKIVAYED